MKQHNIGFRADQLEWVRDNCVNFPELIRRLLDTHIEAKKQEAKKIENLHKGK